jgi:DNA-binding beta-propeller fold protein YncE
VQLFADGRFIAVANSNRFATAHGTVSVVDAAQALAGKAATVETVDVGFFPREWTRSPDGQTLYLTEFVSSTLAVFDVREHFRDIHRARD